MASLSVCGFAAGTQAIAGFDRPKAITLRCSTRHLSLHSLPFGIKWQYLIRKTAQRDFAVFASNSGKNTGGEEKSGGNKGSESNASAQGPPLPTILAGFVAFFVVFWVIKSIVFGIIALIVNLASS